MLAALPTLREERDTLREHLRQIFEAHGQGAQDIVAYSVALGMTKQEASVLSLLVRRGIVSVEQFRLLMNNASDFDSNILSTLICRIRRRLREAHGLDDAIKTSWGMGYHLTAPARRRIQEIVDAWTATVGPPCANIQSTIHQARRAVANEQNHR